MPSSPIYVAIDIETTGLNPDRHQILEFAAVAWVDQGPIEDQPYFRELVRPEGDIVGSPKALTMNLKLLEQFEHGDGHSIQETLNSFRRWLYSLGVTNSRRAYIIGKNFASFDLRFLGKYAGWPYDLFVHRCLDVGSLYATPAGVPSTAEIPFTAYIPGNPHEALFDARLSLEQVRLKFSKWLDTPRV